MTMEMVSKNLRATDGPFHSHGQTAKIANPVGSVVSLLECHILFMGTVPLHKFAASTLGHTSGQVIDP